MFINRTVAPARVAISVIPVLITLNLSNSVNSRLPPLNYETWLTSFLFICTMFSLCAVFEYGFVAFLMSKETAGDAKFKAVVATVAHERKQAEAKVKALVETKAMVPYPVVQEMPEETLIFRPSPKQTGSKEGFAKLRFGANVSPDQVKVNLTTEVQKATTAPRVKFEVPLQVQRIFNPRGLEMISAKQLRWAFRRLGKRFSLGQVQEIMRDMGVKGDELTREELLTLLSDLSHHMPTDVLSTSFWDKPTSEKVDVVFRWCFVTALGSLTIVWLMTAKH